MGSEGANCAKACRSSSSSLGSRRSTRLIRSGVLKSPKRTMRSRTLPASHLRPWAWRIAASNRSAGVAVGYCLSKPLSFASALGRSPLVASHSESWPVAAGPRVGSDGSILEISWIAPARLLRAAMIWLAIKRAGTELGS